MEEYGPHRAHCSETSCVDSQFVHAVYSQQDSLGLKSWGAYAAAAGVSDTLTFAKCSHTPTFARIDSGLALARRLALQGTPTIIVNGWQFPVPPQPELLSTVIDEIIAGRDPKTAYQAAR
jgi:protein-disulfide isomerase